MPHILRLIWVPLLCSLAFGQGGAIGPKAVIGPKGVVYPGATGGGSAVIAISQQTATNTSGVTSATCTLASTVGGGDLLEIDGLWGNTVTPTITATDSLSNTFAHVTASPIASSTVGDNTSFLMYVKSGSGGSSDTITVAVAGSGSHRLIIADRKS